jgi:hypothetical protein
VTVIDCSVLATMLVSRCSAFTISPVVRPLSVMARMARGSGLRAPDRPP